MACPSCGAMVDEAHEEGCARAELGNPVSSLPPVPHLSWEASASDDDRVANCLCELWTKVMELGAEALLLSTAVQERLTPAEKDALKAAAKSFLALGDRVSDLIGKVSTAIEKRHASS